MADLAPIEIEGAAPPEVAPAPTPPDAAKPNVVYTTEPGYVGVHNPEGGIEGVPVENYGKALANGYRPATRGEINAAKEGALGSFRAGLEGGVRGATFGLSDAAAVGLGHLLEGEEGAEKVRQGLAEDLEVHPTASVVGEIGGSLLPLAVGAPPVGAEAEGASLLARTAAAAPRLFAEGTAFGAGHQLTEDMLGNHDLVAGKYAAAGLEGGLVNLLLGSVLHAAGGAITDKLAARARELPEALSVRRGAEVTLDSSALEAGIRGPFETESPFVIDPQKLRPALRPDVVQRGTLPLDEPFSISRGMKIDPDAGLFAPKSRAAESTPIYPGKSGQVRLAGDAFRVGKVETGPRPVREGSFIEFDPEAGIADRMHGKFQGKVPAADAAFRFVTAKAPRHVSLADGIDAAGVDIGSGPIRIPAVSTLAPESGSRSITKLRELAEIQAAKGVMPSTTLGASDLAKLGRTTEEQESRMRQIGRTLLDEGITTPGATKSSQSQRLAERIDAVGQELGTIRAKLAASDIRPDASRIMDRIRSEVMTPLLRRPFSDAEVASLRPYYDDIAYSLGNEGEKGVTFGKLHELRRELDRKLDPKLWQKIPGTAPIAAEELGKVRGILESEYEAAADKAAANIGDDLATKYRVAKAKYSDLKTAERWAKKGAAREAQNRSISLTDTIMAGAGIASGHGALAVGGALANKAMRTYGNQVAAYALDRLTKLEAVQRAAVAFDTKLAAATKAFFGHGEPPARSSAKRLAITPEERVALRTAAKQPGVLAEHVSDAVAREGLYDAAPMVSAALSQSVIRAAQWASAKLPPEPRRVGASFGPAQPRKLGPRGEAELSRAIEALDADKMLDDLARRRLSREQVEALKFVNPELYYEIRKSVRAYAAENEPDMTPQQEMALSIVFDTPVSSYTSGATIRGFQDAFAQGAPSGEPMRAGEETTGKPIGKGHSEAAESLASPTDRAEANGEL